jgi:hypothetical protein
VGSAGTAGEPTLPPVEEPSIGSRAASLAVLDGLVDGGRLFVCVKASEGFVNDSPQPPEGLAFGDFARLPLDWDLAGTDMQVQLYAAREGSEPASSCAALDGVASAPSPSADAGADGGAADVPTAGALRAGSLTLARGSLFAGRHYALVASGCAAPDALPAPDVCGPPDPLFGARAELVLVEFGAEATEGGRYFGLQFLNASRVIAAADLSLQLNEPSVSVPFVSGVGFGVLRPRAVATVEQPLALELRGRGASAIAYSQLWSDTLEASALELQPGKNYLLTSIGPEPRPDGLSLSAPKLVLIPAE